MTDTATARLQALELENQRLQRSVHELSLLNELAREIGASFDAQQIMHKIIRRALKSVKAEQGVITLVKEREDDTLTTFVRTAGSTIQQDAFHLNDSLMGWMMHHKQPLLLNEPREDSRFQGTRWHPSIRSILCVPLLIRSRLTGVLAVYNKKAGSAFTPDDQRLLTIIAAQSAQIVENARLYQEEEALTRMREEMRLAFEIQTSLLPKAPPAVPGYDIAGISLPAQTVGGDYFDYIPLDEDRLGVCVGDVSGKGLPASLLMANVQATLRGQAPWSPTAKTCLERANKLLCKSIRKGTFITLFYGALDPHHHTFRYANAGHNRPLLCTHDGHINRLDLGDVVLGFLPTGTYQEATLSFQQGDLLLIYSDGISEAMNPAREQFGDERLTALLQAHRSQSSQTLIDHILQAVQHHAGETPPDDDRTLLLIKRCA
ncbi:MAG: PP2C family protein-serine/threonine phosphatase [Rhodothermales bacterium]